MAEIDDARKKVEDFKNHLKCNPAERMMINSTAKLPNNLKDINLVEQWNVEARAYDEAIAKHLGVELTDLDEVHSNDPRVEAKRWAESLPD